MLSFSGERDVDVQNVLSGELCAVPLEMFYPNGAVAYCNLLGFTENLDLKYKFNVAFWLFSTR